MAKASKSKPFSIRVDLEKFGFVKNREKLESGQQVVDYLLNKYWWENKMPHVTPKEAPPLEMKIEYHKPTEAAYDGKQVVPVEDAPLSFDTLKQQMQPVQTRLKSFEQWQQAKRECESPEKWEEIKSGIQSAQNLTKKQQDFLIKYS